MAAFLFVTASVAVLVGLVGRSIYRSGSCWIPGSWSGKLCPDFFPPPIGVQQMQVNIKNLVDDAQCYDTVRELRWPEGR